MNIGIIIQARVGSTRFPHKMTVPFYDGRGILHFLLSRMVSTNIPAPIILAIPDTPENDVLEEIGTSLNLKIFRGSEQDVMSRFINAALHYKISDIIRVCADNPFLDNQSIISLIENLKNSDSDYISYCLSDGTPTIKTHFGFWPEAVRLSALQAAADRTTEKYYREHVTNFIYAADNGFTRHCIPISSEIELNNWARFTVDTAQDFKNMQQVAKLTGMALAHHSPLQMIKHIESFPHLKTSMQEEIKKNLK